MLAGDSLEIFEGPYRWLFSLTVPGIRQAWSALSDIATSRGAPPARLLPGLYFLPNGPVYREE